ncbi:MAG TPA: methyltransferase domain-containing protein [Azospirillum sp.]
MPKGAAVLEAGAGSGRWLKALTDRGYDVTGIELNRADVDRFRSVWPDIRFDHGSVEHMPYDDGRFDAVLSLGVIEHMFYGSEQALAEMRRVQKPGGVMLLTVPHANASFWFERLKDAVLYRAYRSDAIRRFLGKPKIGYSREAEQQRLKTVRSDRRPGFAVKYRFSRDAGREFYEYRFTTAQIARMVERAGFAIESVHVLYQADRLYQIFGRLLGRYDQCRSPRLNRLGRLVAGALPSSWIGHMVLVVARAV